MTAQHRQIEFPTQNGDVKVDCSGRERYEEIEVRGCGACKEAGLLAWTECIRDDRAEGRGRDIETTAWCDYSRVESCE